MTFAEWNQSVVRDTIARLVAPIDGTQQRFFLLWRRLAEQLADDHGAGFARLPADTRVPDHTIWQHLDTTAGLKAADAGSNSNAAFLSFSLGPVQPFIAAARSLRDLWSGSMILAWLTYQGILPIVKRLGATALVYPSLRGLPWLDLWLRDEQHLDMSVDLPPTERRLAPCIPNRFLALVPWGQNGDSARELASECRHSAQGAWAKMADAVHEQMHQAWATLAPDSRDWDAHWPEQIDHYFEIRTAVLPWRECTDEKISRLIAGSRNFQDAFPDAADVRKLAVAIPTSEQPGYTQNCAGSWQAKVELSARLMQAQRTIRHVSPSTEISDAQQDVPPKCSLLGSYEQMGPAGLDDSRRFWEAAARINVGGVRIRAGERFSAVALVKRFSGPCFFRRVLKLESDDMRYEDTATVAAAKWLAQTGIEPTSVRREYGTWSGQWLHWASPTQGRKEGEEDIPREIWDRLQEARRKERPPAYYAVLMLDGDQMGHWLRGQNSPRVREVLHPKLRDYFCELKDASPGLDARRPVGPALHAAISEALANFALHFVPEIVERHSGRLIYAGGDDVLALLPTRTALACAAELSETFRTDWKPDPRTGRERLLMGQRATVSAGLAVVHHKEDLRFALDAARKAEKSAKNAGRNALQISVCRRSGEHATALCPWDFVGTVECWVQAFADKASDRWAYHLRAEEPTLQGLDAAAMEAEIRRQVERAEQQTRQLLGEDDGSSVGSQMAAAFATYRTACTARQRPGQPKGRQFTDGEALSQFITLCQSASFLARGRDE